MTNINGEIFIGLRYGVKNHVLHWYKNKIITNLTRLYIYLRPKYQWYVYMNYMLLSVKVFNT